MSTSDPSSIQTGLNIFPACVPTMPSKELRKRCIVMLQCLISSTKRMRSVKEIMDNSKDNLAEYNYYFLLHNVRKMANKDIEEQLMNSLGILLIADDSRYRQVYCSNVALVVFSLNSCYDNEIFVDTEKVFCVLDKRNDFNN